MRQNLNPWYNILNQSYGICILWEGEFTMAKTEKVKAKTSAAKKAEPKKLTAKEEPKKLAAKEPVKRVATKKQEKIAVKPEPKKVTTKEVKKLAVQPEPKKVAVKEVKKVAMKDEPKKAVKKTAVKKTAKKETAKAVEIKEIPKAVKKKTVKKATAKNEKQAYYDEMSLDDCIMNMRKMNVQYGYEDYAQLLYDETDIKQLIQNIHEGNHLGDFELDYKIDGYDQDLVKVTLDKVKKTLDLTPADFKQLKQAMDKAKTFKMSDDAEVNAEEYLSEFHLCERISMLAKCKRIHALEEMNKVLKSDVSEFTAHFMNLAYDLLPTWQYNDVVFYEDFMYSFISLFDELYLIYEQRIQLDCADLYIRHGDRDRGNAGYDYLLRENQIKDYIYYRFAHVYEDIDMGMAKSIAQSSLQYVDDRYVYYPNIIEILNK